jgi:hypothetical protein
MIPNTSEPLGPRAGEYVGQWLGSRFRLHRNRLWSNGLGGASSSLAAPSLDDPSARPDLYSMDSRGRLPRRRGQPPWAASARRPSRRRGDLITLSGCGSLVTITPAEVDSLHRRANDDAHLQRFPCPDPDAELNWVERKIRP